MLDLQNELNDKQRQAVLQCSGPLLVIAGAGSGKTRVITYRVAHLVENLRVAPHRILAVTFTNKAAREMRDRITRLLGSTGFNAWVFTFHSLCARLLRIHADQVGVDKSFTIYDDADQKAMIMRCLKALAIQDMPPRLIQHEIEKAKRELVPADEYPASDFYREKIRNIYTRYEEMMKEANALDFGDLIFRMVRSMDRSEEIRKAVAGRFDYILADEFQDTNTVQLRLIRLLARDHLNICVVGDDDQSIYSWRGADITNILEFEKSFPAAKTVTLDRNYRSTSNILKGAHGVVSKLENRREKELWTSAPEGEHIGYFEAQDEREEARLVAKGIRDLLNDGYSLGEQAVFYRINAQSRVFEEVLRSFNIPHKVVGGMRFYERAEIKDMLAYLRLIQNTADLAAFLRIVNTPQRGIGKASVDKLIAVAAKHGVFVFEGISLAAESLGAAALSRLEAFKTMVESWRSEIKLGPAHLTKRVLEGTGYMSKLKEEDTAEAEARMENLSEFVGSLEIFEKEADTPSLESYLELIALQTDVDAVDFDGEHVTLMTVHAAKGLEFDAVFVTGLEEDLFPYKRNRDSLLGVSVEEMEEERRLCYVAMTRAKKSLFLTSARRRQIFGRERCNQCSRFLADIPGEVIRDLSIEKPRVEPLSAYNARISLPSKKANAGDRWVDRSFDQSKTQTFYPGMRVISASFGVGEVIDIRPGGEKVEVLFPVYGKKTMSAKHLDIE